MTRRFNAFGRLSEIDARSVVRALDARSDQSPELASQSTPAEFCQDQDSLPEDRWRGLTTAQCPSANHISQGHSASLPAITCYPAALPCPDTRPRMEASRSWIVANIHRIMTLSGILTMTMIYAALAPEAARRSMFGENVSGPVADIVVRNWGALIALVGAMLIHGARKPAVRSLALTVAGASKPCSSRWYSRMAEAFSATRPGSPSSLMRCGSSCSRRISWRCGVRRRAA